MLKCSGTRHDHTVCACASYHRRGGHDSEIEFIDAEGQRTMANGKVKLVPKPDSAKLLYIRA